MEAREYTLAMEAAKLRAQRLRREAAEAFWGEVARSLRNAWGAGVAARERRGAASVHGGVKAPARRGP